MTISVFAVFISKWKYVIRERKKIDFAQNPNV